MSAAPQPAPATGCRPACLNGLCRRGYNTAAYYCDCSNTGFTGATCNSTTLGILAQILPSGAQLA